MPAVSEYLEAREIATNLTLRELRGTYKRSTLGWTWSLLNPIASVAIYSLVFSFFLKIEPPVGDPSGLHSFVMFLLCGLLPWNLFSNGVNGSMGSLLSNANLIQKVYFPRELLIGSAVGASVITLLIELVVLLGALLIFGNMVLPWIPMMLVLVVLLAILVVGFGLTLSILNVYFRDMQHFIPIALQALFYSTPIVYPITLVPEEGTVLGITIPVETIYRLNPLVHVVEAFRDTLYDLRFPPLGSMLYITAWAAGSLAFGLWVFSRGDRRLAEEV